MVKDRAKHTGFFWFTFQNFQNILNFSKISKLKKQNDPEFLQTFFHIYVYNLYFFCIYYLTWFFICIITFSFYRYIYNLQK